VEHQPEEPGQAPSQTDDAIAAGEAPLSLAPGAPLHAADALRLQRTAGNRALGRLLQRRTATPERSNATRTFTYELKLYTVDEASYAEAEAIAKSLNAFSSSVFDEQTQSDFTVRFRVAVYAPPEPDILERAFGVQLRYRTGRRQVRRKRYREAAERWWLRFLREPDNTGNLYLGEGPPSEETKAFIRERGSGREKGRHEEIVEETKDLFKEARRTGAPGGVKAAEDHWRKEHYDLAREDPEGTVKKRLEAPNPSSRGTTFAGMVVQMRPRPGSETAHRHSARLHEMMHLLGFSSDYEGARPSLMSYDWVNAHESEVVMPYPDDVEQLVYGDNPPATTSVD